VATYPIKELMKQWETERLTMQQIIGHILQHISALEEQIKDLKRQLSKSSSKRCSSSLLFGRKNRRIINIIRRFFCCQPSG
jgi:hypothetical protein